MTRSRPASPLLVVALLVAATACPSGCNAGKDFTARRKAFRTAIRQPPASRTPAPTPPAEVYELVKYDAPLGMNAAYVTPARSDGKKRPAILWIAGGFDWGIDESAWAAAPRDNDQSARAFREAGLVEMLPSLRGCNDNPGDHEYFLGEVDDVLAALEYLRGRPDVDPARVYLGGHSTGGTLALLAAASRPGVRAVFSFGPVSWIAAYARTGTALDKARDDELSVRSPALSLREATAPIFIIEGDKGNVGAFPSLQLAARTAPVRLLVARGATHFSELAPITELIAKRIVREAAGEGPFELTEEDLAQAVARR